METNYRFKINSTEIISKPIPVHKLDIFEPFHNNKSHKSLVNCVFKIFSSLNCRKTYIEAMFPLILF